MLNSNKENKYRHIPEDMEIVVLFNISIYRKCLLFFVYYKPITNTACVRARLCKLQKGCTRLAAVSDKVDQLLSMAGREHMPYW
jgi:hypothetical protein